MAAELQRGATSAPVYCKVSCIKAKEEEEGVFPGRRTETRIQRVVAHEADGSMVAGVETAWHDACVRVFCCPPRVVYFLSLAALHRHRRAKRRDFCGKLQQISAAAAAAASEAE